MTAERRFRCLCFWRLQGLSPALESTVLRERFFAPFGDVRLGIASVGCAHGYALLAPLGLIELVPANNPDDLGPLTSAA